MLEFKLLSLEEKVSQLYEHGVYIGKCKRNGNSVLLYQLESFYVEVFYTKHRCYVSRLNCFTTTTLLDPYLDEIDVDHLVYAP